MNAAWTNGEKTVTDAPRVLVVEDEPNIRELVCLHLGLEGYACDGAGDGSSALKRAEAERYDLLVLDVMLPGLDGVSLCRAVRRGTINRDVPILMLTARGEESDKVIGLESGADDYLTKPFGVRELVARVKALLRRLEASAASPEVLKSGKLVIDSSRRTVSAGGKLVALTATEFNLLKALAEKEGRVISREDLLSLARGDDVAVMDRTVDVHVAALRKKLGKHGEMIETVRGVGYRLKE